MAWKRFLTAMLIVVMGISLLPAPGNAVEAKEPATFLEMTIGKKRVIKDGTGSDSLPTAPIRMAGANGETIPLIPLRHAA